jgi:uncharacterized membrane protein
MAIVFALLCVFIFVVPAFASLKFCNQTSANVNVAVGYVEKDAPGVSTGGHRGVTVEGWWEFMPGECAAVTDIDRASNYWIYYTAHGHAGRWEGATMLCVSPKAFKTVGEFMRSGDTCVGSRYLAGFRRADAEARTHTITLK